MKTIKLKIGEAFDFLKEKDKTYNSEIDYNDMESYVTPNFPRDSNLLENDINYYTVSNRCFISKLIDI